MDARLQLQRRSTKAPSKHCCGNRCNVTRKTCRAQWRWRSKSCLTVSSSFHILKTACFFFGVFEFIGIKIGFGSWVSGGLARSALQRQKGLSKLAGRNPEAAGGLPQSTTGLRSYTKEEPETFLDRYDRDQPNLRA